MTAGIVLLVLALLWLYLGPIWGTATIAVLILGLVVTRER